MLVKAGLTPQPPGQNPSAAAGLYPLPQPKHAQSTLHPQSRRVCSGSSLPGSTRSLAHTTGPCRTQENTGHGPRCPPRPSPASPAALEFWTETWAAAPGRGPLGLRRAPGPPGVRAGPPQPQSPPPQPQSPPQPQRGSLPRSRRGDWGLQSSGAQPRASQHPVLQRCSGSPSTARWLQTPRELPPAAPPEAEHTGWPSSLYFGCIKKEKETGF